MLLNVIITHLATATKPEFIQVLPPPSSPVTRRFQRKIILIYQSLIQVFATLLIVHEPTEILNFCVSVQTSDGSTGLHVLLRLWTETFEVLQGYNQIRLSVVALARVFEVQGLTTNCGVDEVFVKGEEIVPDSKGRIVTRSQRRKGNPPFSYSPSPCTSASTPRYLYPFGVISLPLLFYLFAFTVGVIGFRDCVLLTCFSGMDFNPRET
jgi:hypothetical protein